MILSGETKGIVSEARVFAKIYTSNAPLQSQDLLRVLFAYDVGAIGLFLIGQYSVLKHFRKGAILRDGNFYKAFACLLADFCMQAVLPITTLYRPHVDRPAGLFGGSLSLGRD